MCVDVCVHLLSAFIYILCVCVCLWKNQILHFGGWWWCKFGIKGESLYHPDFWSRLRINPDDFGKMRVSPRCRGEEAGTLMFQSGEKSGQSDLDFALPLGPHRWIEDRDGIECGTSKICYDLKLSSIYGLWFYEPYSKGKDPKRRKTKEI